MYQLAKRQWNKIFVILLIIITYYGAIQPFNSVRSDIAANPLILYQVADPTSLYQTDQFNVSISLTNIYYQDLTNVSIEIKVLSQVEFLFASEENVEYDNETDKISYLVGNLAVDQKIHLIITYNVTSKAVETVTLPNIKVNFMFQNGITGTIESSGEIELFFKGQKVISSSTSLKPIPTGTKSPPPYIEFVIFSIPILAFAFTILIYRVLKLQKKK
ncbi:MAG: hypothetical protein ACTSW1_18095 [Candidatus Hodarchaeales archaeon]